MSLLGVRNEGGNLDGATAAGAGAGAGAVLSTFYVLIPNIIARIDIHTIFVNILPKFLKFYIFGSCTF